jgi:hypothetical protein
MPSIRRIVRRLRASVLGLVEAGALGRRPPGAARAPGGYQEPDARPAVIISSGG